MDILAPYVYVLALFWFPDFDQVNAHVAGHLSDLADSCVIFILKIKKKSHACISRIKKIKK